jgi:hypothetical protein
MMGLILATGGGGLLTAVEAWGLLGLSLVLAVAVVRLSRTRMLYLFMSALAIFLVISPLGIMVEQRTRWGSLAVNRSAGLFRGASVNGDSDVFLIVADAYGGPLALGDVYGFDNRAFNTSLERQGFSLLTAWASYPLTQYSLSSLLEMDYVAEDGSSTSPASTAYLHEIVGGDNRFVSILKASGFEFTMIEAGWGGSRCGGEVDHCVPAPLYDDGLSAIAASSIAQNALRSRLGHGFTQSSVASMKWLMSNAERLSSNKKSDLVMAHLMVPHPPTFLDAECRVRTSDIFNSPLLRNVEDSENVVRERRAGYLDQLQCVNRFLSEFLDLVSPESTVIVMGDHGPESQGQTFTHPLAWSDQQITERLNPYLAVRVAKPCDLATPIVLPNVLRTVVGCLTGTVEPALPNRLFLVVELDAPAQIYELPQQRVTNLLAAA